MGAQRRAIALRSTSSSSSASLVRKASAIDITND
jgi:hypothetical protein